MTVPLSMFKDQVSVPDNGFVSYWTTKLFTPSMSAQLKWKIEPTISLVGWIDKTGLLVVQLPHVFEEDELKEPFEDWLDRIENVPPVSITATPSFVPLHEYRINPVKIILKSRK